MLILRYIFFPIYFVENHVPFLMIYIGAGALLGAIIYKNWVRYVCLYILLGILCVTMEMLGYYTT